MSNGVRHLVGAVIGLIAGAVVMGLLIWGLEEVADVMRTFRPGYAGYALLVVAALVIGVLVGWRWLSPLAGLLAAVPLLAAGLLWLVQIETGLLRNRFLPDFLTGYGSSTAGMSGLYLILAVVLIVPAAFPDRWRSAKKPITQGYGQPGGYPHPPQPYQQQPHPQQPYPHPEGPPYPRQSP